MKHRKSHNKAVCGTLRNAAKCLWHVYEPKGQGFESLAARHRKSTCILQVLFLTKFAAVRQVKGLRREMHLRCVKYLLRGC